MRIRDGRLVVLARRVTTLGWLGFLLVACDGGSSPPADARVDVEGEAEAEAGDGSTEMDAEADGGGGEPGAPVAGPLGFLSDSFEIVADRACDVDGDGDLDNAIADIGPSYAGLVAGVVNSIGATDQLDGHLLVYLPWVEDLGGPDDASTSLIISLAEPSTETGVFAAAPSLDQCLEPRHSGSASLEGGRLEGSVTGFPLILGSGHELPVEEASLAGTIEPNGARLDMFACGVVRLRDLGGLPLGSNELSLLEVMAGGGAAVGMPDVPGVSPDIDLDGDGLERLFLDDEGRVASCLDGDDTVIEGSDCWLDARIADGISLTARLRAAPTRFDGVAPWGRYVLESDCEAGPPADSAWGSCSGEECSRWSSRSCEPACGGGGRQHCLWGCDGYGACVPTGRDERALSACGDVLLLGGASCDGSPPVVSFVDGPNQLRGVTLPGETVLGAEAIVVEARLRLARGTSEIPCCGWGITAYLDREGEILAADYFRHGINVARRGYVAMWNTTHLVINDVDTFRLRFLDGSGEVEVPTLSATASSQMPPGLDADTEGAIEQAMRVVIVPDLVETAENEQLVAAHILDADGNPLRSLACSSEGCPIPIVEGEPITFVVSSGTLDADSVVELVDLHVEVGGLCP